MSERYTVKSPQEMQGRKVVGSYYEQYGWTVVDLATPTQPYIASGGRREMNAYCRSLNAR